MKRKYLVLFSLIFIDIAAFFAPFFTVNGNLFTIIDFFKNYGYLPVFLMLIAPYLLFLFGTIFICLFRKYKWSIYISFLLILSSIVVVIFTRQSILSNNLQINSLLYNVSPIFLIVVSIILSLYILRAMFDSFKLLVIDLVEIAIFVSFAVILDLPTFKIRIGANGGSISFAMLPLAIICLRKGFFKGFFASGLIFGLVSCLIDGYGIVYFPFDYFLGFGFIAILGLFKKQIFNKDKLFINYVFLFIGMALVFVARTAASTLSGIIYFNLKFMESLVYQLVYVGPSSAICFGALCLLLQPLKKINKRYKA